MPKEIGSNLILEKLDYLYDNLNKFEEGKIPKNELEFFYNTCNEVLLYFGKYRQCLKYKELYDSIDRIIRDLDLKKEEYYSLK